MDRERSDWALVGLTGVIVFLLVVLLFMIGLGAYSWNETLR